MTKSKKNIFVDRYSSTYADQPIVLIDVGASGGIEPTWQSALPYLFVIAFEPDKREFENLSHKANDKYKVILSGLFERRDRITFHLLRTQTSSSIFAPNRPLMDRFPDAERFDLVEQLEIDVDSLDNQLTLNHISDVDFIKLDTQGSELSILAGAKKSIERTVVGLEIEVEFLEAYKGQPLFADVDHFMRDQGFFLFDIAGFYYKRKIGTRIGAQRGQLVFGDALYLRTPESFSKVLEDLPDATEKLSKLLRFVSICSLYGYYDYALEIVDLCGRHFPDEDRQNIIQWIRRQVRFYTMIPSFRGKGRISSLFFQLATLFRPMHQGWAVSERKLGND